MSTARPVDDDARDDKYQTAALDHVTGSDLESGPEQQEENGRGENEGHNANQQQPGPGKEGVAGPDHVEQPQRVEGELSFQQPLPTGEPASEEGPASSPASPARPENPPPYTVFGLWAKRLIVLGASLSAFFSPLTGQVYYPAMPTMAKDLGVTNSEINLTVTTYMIFQGVTPMFIGGLADTAGRRPAYIVCFVIYIAANIGLALSRNYASLLVVRMIQSAGSASTVALAQAVLADCITSAERGQYVGITVLPIVLAQSLGPVTGGLLAQYLGWRSIFWFLAIAATVVFIPLFMFFPETCRAIVGDGSITPHPFYRTGMRLIQDALAVRRRRRERRPSKAAAREDGGGLYPTQTATNTSMAPAAPGTTTTKLKFARPNVLGSLMLLCEKEMGILLGCSALVFCGFYAIAAAMPSLFARIYGYDEIHIALMYLPMAGGSIIAAFIMGNALDRNYRRHARRLGLPTVDGARQADLSAFPIERARIHVGFPLLFLAALSLIGWGWAVDRGTNVAVPCVMMFLLGVGMIGFTNATGTLLIDVCRTRAGAAVASNNLTRCLLGALMSAVILPMTDAMGVGWAFTFLGLLFLVTSPAMWLVQKNGIRWRAEVQEREKRKAEKAGLREENKRQRKAGRKDADKGQKVEDDDGPPVEITDPAGRQGSTGSVLEKETNT